MLIISMALIAGATIAFVFHCISFAAAFDSFESNWKACPARCKIGGRPENWTIYHDTTYLDICEDPVLMDFTVHNSIVDPSTDVTIRACTADRDMVTSNGIIEGNRTLPERQNSTSCAATKLILTEPRRAWWGALETNKSVDRLLAAHQLREYLTQANFCDQRILFASANGVMVGFYSGASVDGQQASVSLMSDFIHHIQTKGMHATMALEICGQNRTANDVFGIVIATNGNLTFVQKTVQSWTDGKCLPKADGEETWPATPLRVFAPSLESNSTNMTTQVRRLQNRALCRTTKVVGGDTCAKLATRCGITSADLSKYNTDAKFCSSLSPGQSVCCSSGTLPDTQPCATRSIKGGDTCYSIATSEGLKLNDLANMNKETWGWTGCGNLQIGMNICISKGAPPMPAAVPNAVCGPSVPGTKRPPPDKLLADLNPCPLKTCCNIWGQCGTTKDFCTISKSETGNPGTSAPGKNGCIANCGMEVINNKEKPEKFLKVAYFEGWNMERLCLNMDIRRIDKSYTHVHFSFAELTPDFDVLIDPKVKGQFDAFKKLSGPKRVLAFGGWSFSTDHDTFPIFRESVTPANRALFADRVVKFLNDNKLDGLDFDWEYPGAPDIPGVPPGGKNDGKNYLEFLKIVRGKLPKEKTLSVAAPASFWYLKGFPIAEMAPVLDYIVYMTYDLHGQWDYDNKWANPGCPSGNCLRSHVNYTETYNALAMITKAGVPAKKVVVGVASYGRSFKMADANCRGPMCKFTGSSSESFAQKGMCTNTSGYISNAEIKDIIEGGDNIKTWTDETESDYLVYDNTEWVAYMSDEIKAKRTKKYQAMNFGGTSDWAVDLQAFLPNGVDPEAPPPSEIDSNLESCDSDYATLDDVANDAGKISSRCAPIYVLRILKRLLDESLASYDDIMHDGYDKKFDLYAKTVAGMGPSALRDYFVNHGDQYFSCEIVERVTCCRGCYYVHGDNDPACKYCSDPLCRQSTPWGGFKEGISEFHNFSERCLPDTSQRGLGPHDEQSIYWTLRPDRESQWWEDIYQEFEMEKDDVTFVPRTLAPNGKPERGCELEENRAESCDYRNYWFNVPRLHDWDKNDISNPKDQIFKALDNIGPTGGDIDTAIFEIKALLYPASANDLVDALAIPVLMVGEAIKAMQAIVKTAEEIEEAQKKEFILLFLSAVLFIVPAIGEGLAAIGLASLGRVLSLLGEAGSAAQGIYDVANSDVSGPLEIIGLVFGAAGGIFDAAKVAQAAKVRRQMSANDVGKLGDDVKGSLDKVTKVLQNGVCKL